MFLAGCQGDDSGGSAGGATADAAPAAQVSLAVADGATDVSPMDPLQVMVTGGKLTDVTVVDGGGTDVDGSVAADATQPDTAVWTPEDQLAYGTSYTLTATAENPAGTEAKASSTFSTVTPTTLSTPSIGPLNGTTVGVGMPIRVYFDDPVADKAAVESHLKVTSSTPTDGAWNWMNDSEVHFRPSQYWPPNTHVTLDANLYGVNFGEGVWGEKDRSVSFDVGAPRRRAPGPSVHVRTTSGASPASLRVAGGGRDGAGIVLPRCPAGRATRAISSIGRAADAESAGSGFESLMAHHSERPRPPGRGRSVFSIRFRSAAGPQ